MAYKDFKEFSLDSQAQPHAPTLQTLQIDGPSVALPDASYIRDAALTRSGADLILDGPHGTIAVAGYYAAVETPNLVAPDGQTLSPALVHSFATSPAQYAQNASMNDASAVGTVDEVSGDATITRLDGSVNPVAIGTLVYEGDIIETSADGAVNISFSDETSFAVSEEARLAIDEYVYDPVTQSGTQDFSVLKGVFVFTSGLIGRDDPDDVNIDTPSGSIGIRGTIIAGNVNNGEITVVEGAIVVRDLFGNEMTLANQFETAKFITQDNGTGGIEHMGTISADDMSEKFAGISKVSPMLFSSIEDAAQEVEGTITEVTPEEGTKKDLQPSNDEEATDAPENAPEVDGSIDQNGDGQVDGSINEVQSILKSSNTIVNQMETAMQQDIKASAHMKAPIEINKGTVKLADGADTANDSKHIVQNDGRAPDAPPVTEQQQGPVEKFVDTMNSPLNALKDGNILRGDSRDNVFYDSQKQNVSMFGGAGDDIFRITSDGGTSRSYGTLNGGSGTGDTLILLPNGSPTGNLNFANVEGMTGIERIDLSSGGGDFHVKIDVATVITNESDRIEPSLGYTQILRIDGEANDKVDLDLDTGWVSAGTYTDGETYNVYTNGSDTIIIDTDIATTLI